MQLAACSTARRPRPPPRISHVARAYPVPGTSLRVSPRTTTWESVRGRREIPFLTRPQYREPLSEAPGIELSDVHTQPRDEFRRTSPTFSRIFAQRSPWPREGRSGSAKQGSRQRLWRGFLLRTGRCGVRHHATHHCACQRDFSSRQNHGRSYCLARAHLHEWRHTKRFARRSCADSSASVICFVVNYSPPSSSSSSSYGSSPPRGKATAREASALRAARRATRRAQ